MLDAKTRELVAIGASVVAKCQPCLSYHIEEAATPAHLSAR